MSNELTLADLTGAYKDQRELKSITIPERFKGLGGKTVYFYDIVTIGERRAATQFNRIDAETGTVVLDEEAVVEGLIARLRKSDGSPLFFRTYKRELLTQSSADLLRWIWQAIGGVGSDSLQEAIEEAGKN